MKRKTPYYIVVDLFDIRKTTIECSKRQVAYIVDKHRNTIDYEQDNIYGHYFVLPRFIKNSNRTPIKGPFPNLKNQHK